jgi:hypothetical protein
MKKKRFSLKTLFKKSADDPRFIDIFGFPWDSTDLLDILRTPDMQFGTVVAALAATTDIVSGAGNPAMTVLYGVFYAFMYKGLSFRMTSTLVERDFQSDIKTLRDFAIDTEGRSPPPEHIDFLMNQLRILRRCHIGFIGTGGLFLALGLTAPALERSFNQIAGGHVPSGRDIITAGLSVVTLIDSARTLNRIHKLLNGTYSFCGNPPKNPAEAPSPAAVPAFAPALK